MKAWLAQHSQAFILTLKHFIHTPITNVLSMIVIGIAFSLPVGVYTLLENIQLHSGAIGGKPQLSLYLKRDVNKNQALEIRKKLEEQSLIESFKFIHKDQALKQLAQNNDLARVTGNIGDNPLPHAFVVTSRHTAAGELEQLRTAMQAWPGVEYVQFDSNWAKRLDTMLDIGRLAVAMLATLLSIALVMVIFNTIRLQILTKREEIEVSKLIGATDGFIHRPFLYFGALQGFAGGLTAWLIIVIGVQILNDELVALAELYTTHIQLEHLDIKDSISLLLFSTWLGWLGARMSVASYLWKIEPK
ncbi:MAG: permease-like cell division protein FtsX [Gammaproteobacteria bacterium]|nr:permease-like cell division protein FtsX [Gammaproteobacteria bacterium]